MTGRTIRMVKRKGQIRAETRASEIGIEGVNIYERELFQSGQKLVGIISDAASTGMSDLV